MKVVGLISGGKDSCYNLLQCIAAGHTIEALANLAPKNSDEIDSYMYQSVGHMGISLYAEAMGLPLYRREIEGTSLNTKSIDYLPTEGDEVEDLYYLLKEVKEELGVEAVSVGAVFSDYQRVRVENVCQRLGLISLAYMWRRDQSELLQEMVDCGIEAILIKVAAIGLTPSKHLGKTITEMQSYLENLKEKYKINVCGEGGEYETFTLDCPLFRKKIVIDETELIETPGDVGYLNFKSMKLVNKDWENDDLNLSQNHVMNSMKVKRPMDYLLDLRLKAEEQQAEDQAKENSRASHETCDREMAEDNNTETQCSSILEDQMSLISFSSGFLWASVYCTSVHNAMTKLKDILAGKGLALENIVSVKMFVKNMGDYATYNRDYNQYFSINPPTRTCVEIPLDGDVTICMDVIVWKENLLCLEQSNEDTSPSHRPSRSTLHVQSVSHWAPANIGPYSQAVKIGDIIMVAGMIGLVPGTLEILNGEVELQARLSLRHIGRVLAAVTPKANIRSVVQGVCYVTNLKDIGVAKRMMARVSESQISTYVVVPCLPKNALIEWHTWAHLSNDQFDYEERGYSRENVNVTLRRRISSDNSVCVLISTASCQEPKDLSQSVLEDMIRYCLQKMNTGNASNLPMNLTVYYKSSALSAKFVLHTLQMCPDNVSKFIVPVLAVEDKTTLVSIVLIRH